VCVCVCVYVCVCVCVCVCVYLRSLALGLVELWTSRARNTVTWEPATSTRSI